MTRFKLLALLLTGSVAVLAGQGTAGPGGPTDSWPTYNGDYSGRRFSPLTKITSANVKSLSLAWSYRINLPQGTPAIRLAGTPLQINGVLYITIPDHAWAIDARTGRELWHHAWTSKGGIHLGNRGAAVSGDTLYYETPDCNLVALDIKDGKERWHKSICDLDQFYYGSVAPVAAKNHLFVGVSGDDLDIPGYLDARDPATGELQWRWHVVPQKLDEPGSDTWPNEEAMKHGGGMTWTPVTYDPELNIVYVTTGNPQPVVAHKNRAGSNLFTGSIVALNADTGKMVWWFQSSPHDTHDWDSTQTAVLFDGTINGQPRKLIAQAARNGHFFVLDRTNGKAIVSKAFVKTNWSLGYDAKGQPIPNPAKEPQIDGALVSPDQAGANNWPPPAFSPLTGLFYVNARRAFSVYYIYDPDDNPQGWGGTDRGGYSEAMTQAIDYKTGAIKWSHPWEGGSRSGLLVTAGNVLFGGGASNDIIALDATSGDALWHARLNTSVSNGPITYEMDGRQYLVVGAGDTLWTFVMNEAPRVAIRAMLVTGESNRFHDWTKSSPLVKAALEQTGLFSVTVVTAPSKGVETSDFAPRFSDHQVVVLDYETRDWPAATRVALAEYVRNGGGLVTIHAADNGFPDWPEFNEMIGIGGWGMTPAGGVNARSASAGLKLRWRDGHTVADDSPGGYGHPARHTFSVVTRTPEHPIMKGLPAEWLHPDDEIYSQLRGPAKNVTILATALADKQRFPNASGEDEPVLMVIAYGKGRVFHTTLGHVGPGDKPPFLPPNCVGFIVTLQRGTEWAATGAVTQPVPADFPTSQKISVR